MTKLPKRRASRQHNCPAAAETTTSGLPPSDNSLLQRSQCKALETALAVYEAAWLGHEQIDAIKPDPSTELTEGELTAVAHVRLDAELLLGAATAGLVRAMLRVDGQMTGTDDPVEWRPVVVDTGSRIVTVKPFDTPEGPHFALELAEVEIVGGP
jgi:hypothetical protein